MFLIEFGNDIADFHADGAAATPRQLMDAVNPADFSFIVQSGVSAENDLIFYKVIFTHYNSFLKILAFALKTMR